MRDAEARLGEDAETALVLQQHAWLRRLEAAVQDREAQVSAVSRSGFHRNSILDCVW